LLKRKKKFLMKILKNTITIEAGILFLGGGDEETVQQD
jgi:hypothetical protein